MRHLLWTLPLALGCAGTGGTPDGDDMDTDAAAMALHGAWVSAGADVAGVLAGPPGNVVRVDASFTAGGDYTAEAEDSSGGVITFSGTYDVDTDTTPHGITITQASPYQALVEGLWEVDGDTLTYDVTQTMPDLGAVPATVAGGFGSSTVGTANVQTYRRAE